jgi:hypothetical protein
MNFEHNIFHSTASKSAKRSHIIRSKICMPQICYFLQFPVGIFANRQNKY